MNVQHETEQKILIVTDSRKHELKAVIKQPSLITDQLYKEVMLERYSSETITVIENSLSCRGYGVETHTNSRQLVEYIRSNGENFPYSAVINLATGSLAPFRAGQAATFLDMLRVPYSGSDPQTLLVLRDKSLSKVIAKDIGIATPDGLFFDSKLGRIPERLNPDMYPLIVKPNFGCTSVGVSSEILRNPDNDHEHIISTMLKQFPDGVLVEQFIPGVEVTVFVLGTKASGHIIPLILRKRNGDPLQTDFVLTGKRKQLKSIVYDVYWKLAYPFLSEETVKLLEDITWRLADAFRVRDFARFDYRIDEKTGQPFFIECNGQPGLDVSTNSIPTAINREWFEETNKLQDLFVVTFLERVFGTSCPA